MRDYAVREATLDDLDALVRHRIGMFTDMGVDVDRDGLGRAFREWLHKAMPAGEYFAWVCQTDAGDIVSGAGVSLFRWPPGPQPVPGDQLAFVYNVYTEPAHRRRGLARRVMETVHAWCAERGIRMLALNAAADARHLYDSMGYFEAPSPMMWKMT
jgi:GNAT superfamily N-acetyltransferase